MFIAVDGIPRDRIRIPRTANLHDSGRCIARAWKYSQFGYNINKKKKKISNSVLLYNGRRITSRVRGRDTSGFCNILGGRVACTLLVGPTPAANSSIQVFNC